MQIKPLSDHILIEPVKEEEKTKAGIFLPETASKEKSEEGKVVAIGPGKMNDEGKIIPMSIKPGDRVLFTKYGPNEIKIDNKEYLIATESDILVIFSLANQIFSAARPLHRGFPSPQKNLLARSKIIISLR
jgi:chaperonin GroES